MTAAQRTGYFSVSSSAHLVIESDQDGLPAGSAIPGMFAMSPIDIPVTTLKLGGSCQRGNEEAPIRGD